MLMFHDDRADASAMTRAERSALFDEFVGWAESLAARGAYAGSESLLPNAEARTVRRRGHTTVLEGPFAETHEAVNGFVTVVADDLEEAAALAEECPALRLGWAVEIRELREIVRPADAGGALAMDQGGAAHSSRVTPSRTAKNAS